MKLSGKVAVILPGTYGVGHDAAVRFAKEGAKVVIGGADEENGRKTLEAIARAGGEPGIFVRCDLLSEADIERVVGAAIFAHGGVDAAFGCPDYYLPGLAADQSAADLDYSLFYNCRSLFFLTKHAVPSMIERGGGSIVFLTSVYALVSGSASCAYEVSKGTVVAMARTFAERFGAQRIRVNCIAAGHIADGPRDLRDELPAYVVRSEEEIQRLTQFYPIGRLAIADDVACAAVFLASDDSAYATGTTLSLEGGFVTR